MTHKFKAVIIDDVDLCRNFLTDVLEDRGYEVDSYSFAQTFPFCSKHGAQCQREQACADLLLTDNRMPVLTGLELIEKQQARGCKMAAGSRAVVSGCWTKEDRQKAKELGCQTFEKPYDLKGIYAWLNTCEERL
jgi:CheY-like chemotaxis protein